MRNVIELAIIELAVIELAIIELAIIENETVEHEVASTRPLHSEQRKYTEHFRQRNQQNV